MPLYVGDEEVTGLYYGAVAADAYVGAVAVFTSAEYWGHAPGIGAPVSGPYTSHSGELESTSAGQVIEWRDITSGWINVRHDDVTVRNCTVTGTGWMFVDIDDGVTGTLIEDCTFDGGADPGTLPVVGYTEWTMRRCDLSGIAEGPRFGSNCLMEDCYVHGFVDYEPIGAHQDGAQTVGGLSSTIRHNTIICDAPVGSSSIQVGTTFGDVENLLIEYNILGSTVGHGITVGYDPEAPASGEHSNPKNIEILNNRFSSEIYFEAISMAGGEGRVQSGNVWHDGPDVGDPV